jgi:cell division protein FtsB
MAYHRARARGYHIMMAFGWLCLVSLLIKWWLVSGGGVVQITNLDDAICKQEAEIDGTRYEIVQLRCLLYRWQHDVDFVTWYARQQLKLVKPEEKIYVSRFAQEPFV